MSSKSIDPISRRRKGAADPKRSSVVPRTADTAKVLEKAQAALEARKEGRARKRRKGIFTLMIVAIIVFVATAGYMSWQNYNKNRYFAVIDGQYITRRDYDKVMSDAANSKVSKDEATKQYLEIQKQRIAAEKLGVKPTDDNNKFMTKQIYKDKTYNQLNSWEQLLVYELALKAALESAKRGGYQGAIFYFPFAFHQETLGEAFKGRVPDGWRDPNVIAQDEAYAQQKVDEYYAQIKNGAKETDVISVIFADKQLQYAGAPNGSRTFLMAVDPTTKTLGEYLGNGVMRSSLSKDIDANSLRGSSSVGVSDIKTGQMIFYDKPDAPKYDAYYYFYKIDSYKEPQPDIQKTHSSSVQNMQVQVVNG